MTKCIKNDDIVFLDENNNIISSTVQKYLVKNIVKFNGDDIDRSMEFIKTDYDKINGNVIRSHKYKVMNDNNIIVEPVEIGYPKYHIKIKIRKIVNLVISNSGALYNNIPTFTVNLDNFDKIDRIDRIDQIRIDKYPDGFLTLNGNIFPCTKVYSSEIHLTPSEQNYRYIDLDIFGREAFIYTLRPSSFKICDIDGNFIKNISEDCITKKTRDYTSVRRSDDLISVDNMYNYISLKINNEDSVLGRCIIEFDIYA